MSNIGIHRGERLRILVCAHDCSPSLGSECGSAWKLVTALAADHDITVLCATGSQTAPEAYRSAVEQWLDRHGPIEGFSLLFVPQPRLSLWLSKLNHGICGGHEGIGLRPLFYWALRAWHREASK